MSEVAGKGKRRVSGADLEGPPSKRTKSTRTTRERSRSKLSDRSQDGKKGEDERGSQEGGGSGDDADGTEKRREEETEEGGEEKNGKSSKAGKEKANKKKKKDEKAQDAKPKASQISIRKAKQSAKLTAAENITDFRPVEQLARQKGLPAGVYVHHAAGQKTSLEPGIFFNNKRVMAGYHGIRDTITFGRFFNGPSCFKLLSHWIQTKTSTAVTDIQVFAELSKPDVFTKLANIPSNILLTAANIANYVDVSAVQIPVMLLAWVIIRLQKDNPFVYIDAHEPSFHFDAEESYRAFQVAKLAQQEWKKGEPREARFNTANAEVPIYCDPTTADTLAEGKPSNIPQGKGFDLETFIDDIERDQGAARLHRLALNRQNDEEKKQALEGRAIEDQDRAYSRMSKQGKKLATLTEDEKKDFLLQMFKVHGLAVEKHAPEFLHDLGLMTSAELALKWSGTGQQDLGTMAAAGEAAAEETGLLHEQPSVRALTEEEELAEAKARTEKHSLMSKINPEGAKTDSYLDCCKRFDLDPANPVRQATAKVLPAGYKPFVHRPWQVTGSSWCVDQELAGRMRAVILADDMGLGKTMLIYAYLEYIAKLAAESEDEHQPTLLLVQSNLIYQWIEEYERKWKPHSALNLRVWHMSRDTVKRESSLQRYIIDTDELIAALLVPGGEFAVENPDTSRVVILATYTTFASRSVITKDQAIKLAKDVGPRWGFEKFATDVESQEDETDETTETSVSDGSDSASTDELDTTTEPAEKKARLDAQRQAKQQKREAKQQKKNQQRRKRINAICKIMALPRDAPKRTPRLFSEAALADREERRKEEIEMRQTLDNFASVFQGRFARIIADEATDIKNRASLANISVTLLKANFHVLVSGTPTPNKLQDLIAFLKLALPEDVPNIDEWAKVADGKHVDFPDDRGQSGVVQWYRKLAPNDLRLLNWHTFTYLMEKGNMRPEHAIHVLPKIFGLFALKRSAGDIMELEPGKTIKIGGEIPTYELRQIRVMALPHERAAYHRVHSNYIGLISVKSRADASDEGVETRYNMGIVRLISHAGFGSSCDVVSNVVQRHQTETNEKEKEKRDDGVDNIHKFANKDDLSAQFLIDRVVKDPDIAPGAIESANKRLETLCCKFPKLAHVTGLLHFHVILRKEKILVVAEWPMVAWITHVFVALAGFKTMVLTSDMDEQERGIITRRWNDQNDEHMILVTTAKIISFGLNLHSGGCHVVIILEPTVNYLVLLQIICRVHRLGQTQKQFVYHYMGLATVDEYRHCVCYDKMIGMAVAGGVKAFEDMVSGEAGCRPDQTDVDAAKEWEDRYRNAALDVITKLSGAPVHSWLPRWRDIRDTGLNYQGERNHDRDSHEPVPGKTWGGTPRSGRTGKAVARRFHIEMFNGRRCYLCVAMGVTNCEASGQALTSQLEGDAVAQPAICQTCNKFAKNHNIAPLACRPLCDNHQAIVPRRIARALHERLIKTKRPGIPSAEELQSNMATHLATLLDSNRDKSLAGWVKAWMDGTVRAGSENMAECPKCIQIFNGEEDVPPNEDSEESDEDGERSESDDESTTTYAVPRACGRCTWSENILCEDAIPGVADVACSSCTGFGHVCYTPCRKHSKRLEKLMGKRAMVQANYDVLREELRGDAVDPNDKACIQTSHDDTLNDLEVLDASAESLLEVKCAECTLRNQSATTHYSPGKGGSPQPGQPGRRDEAEEVQTSLGKNVQSNAKDEAEEVQSSLEKMCNQAVEMRLKGRRAGRKLRKQRRRRGLRLGKRQRVLTGVNFIRICLSVSRR